jgi:hypothetical protein
MVWEAVRVLVCQLLLRGAKQFSGVDAADVACRFPWEEVDPCKKYWLRQPR